MVISWPHFKLHKVKVKYVHVLTNKAACQVTNYMYLDTDLKMPLLLLPGQNSHISVLNYNPGPPETIGIVLLGLMDKNYKKDHVTCRYMPGEEVINPIIAQLMHFQSKS